MTDINTVTITIPDPTPEQKASLEIMVLAQKREFHPIAYLGRGTSSLSEEEVAENERRGKARLEAYYAIIKKYSVEASYIQEFRDEIVALNRKIMTLEKRRSQLEEQIAALQT